MNQAKRKLIIARAAKKHKLRPSVLWGVYGAESNFGRNRNSSSAGAQGPFQFMPATARGMGVDPHNFKSAAYGAAKYLSQYKGRGLKGMLAAYNAGPAGNPNNAETRDYVQKVPRLAKTWDGPDADDGGGKRGKGFKRLGVEIGEKKTFDDAGYEDARRKAIVGQLIASRKGTGGILFKTGLLTTTAPDKADFADTELTSKVVGRGRVKGEKATGSGPSEVLEMKRIADAVDKKAPRYQWGGGHGGSPAPIGANVDCSGFVSQVLGVSPRTSGGFLSWGRPGKGKHVTVWTNQGHVLIQIGKHFYATSRSNRGGGAGKISRPDSGYLSNFTPRHPKGL